MKVRITYAEMIWSLVLELQSTAGEGTMFGARSRGAPHSDSSLGAGSQPDSAGYYDALTSEAQSANRRTDEHC